MKYMHLIFWGISFIFCFAIEVFIFYVDVLSRKGFSLSPFVVSCGPLGFLFIEKPAYIHSLWWECLVFILPLIILGVLFRYAKVLLSIITFFFCVSWILIGLLAYLCYRNEEDCDKGNLAVPIHLMSERQTRRGSSN